jgi:hypothetical protein
MSILFQRMCDFNSGSLIRLHANTAHAVLVCRDSDWGDAASVGLTPDGMRALAVALNRAADQLETSCPHCHRPHTDPMVCGRGGCPMGGDQ